MALLLTLLILRVLQLKDGLMQVIFYVCDILNNRHPLEL